MLLLRHGVTEQTLGRVFSGRGGSDPALTDEGHAQAARAAAWIGRHHDVAALVCSPMLRTRETAEPVAAALGLEVEIDDDLAEMDFGDWDGLTLDTVREGWGAELTAWFADETLAPPGGESLAAVGERADRVLARLLAAYAGRTVVAVTHVTPIKALVRRTLEVDPVVMHRMRVAPASVSVTQWWPDGVRALQTFSHVPD